MGMPLLFSLGGKSYNVDTATKPNPNKYRFEILKIYKGNVYDVVIVKYPDCNTFEGRKILLMEKAR